MAAVGGGGTTSTAPVDSTSSFNLLSAYVSSFTTTSSNPFTVTGTTSGFTVTGSGTATNGAVTSGTFESLPSLQRTVTVIGNVVANGQTVSLASSQVAWTDSNYIPRGQSGGDEYIVVTGTPTFPSTARVNDTGPIYTANRYTNSSKVTLNGTSTITYMVEADTASTVLVTLINTYRNTSSATTQTATAQFRINTSNIFTRIKETVVIPASSTSLTLTY